MRYLPHGTLTTPNSRVTRHLSRRIRPLTGARCGVTSHLIHLTGTCWTINALLPAGATARRRNFLCCLVQHLEIFITCTPTVEYCIFYLWLRCDYEKFAGSGPCVEIMLARSTCHVIFCVHLSLQISFSFSSNYNILSDRVSATQEKFTIIWSHPYWMTWLYWLLEKSNLVTCTLQCLVRLPVFVTYVHLRIQQVMGPAFALNWQWPFWIEVGSPGRL